jgi:hypothetical protein
MRPRVPRSALGRYGLAIVCVVATAGVAVWLRPFVVAAAQLSLVAILIDRLALWPVARAGRVGPGHR